MNLSFFIAKRYLFSKKSQNAINIISMVAVCGIAVATLATVCTLSVFNGFQGLVSDMFSAFDPELKITPAKGKVFDPTTVQFQEVRTLPEIELISESLEDNGLIRYRNRQVPAVLKGVTDNFADLSNFRDILYDGEFVIKDEINSYGILGIGLASNLSINAAFITPMEIYTPKRNVQVNLANPSASFTQAYFYISGVFMVNQPVYDDNYLILPIELTRELFDYTNEVSALEIKLKAGSKTSSVQKKIQQIIGGDYEVKDRYQQQESAFKMMKIEKWVTFLMLCFILLIAVFNVIGSLSMLIVDKQKDIVTLRNLGAENALISRIFFIEGWMITILGGVVGLILGVLLCLGQQHFGWLQLGTGGNFAVSAYPVDVHIQDLIIVFISVLLIGFLSVLYPVRYLSKKWLT